MSNSRVLATVNGTPITEEDVQSLLKSLGQNRAMQFDNEMGRRRLLDELINQELFYLYAVKNGYDQEPAFKIGLEEVKKNLLKQYSVEKYLSAATVEDEEIAQYYEDNKDTFRAGESVKASHILVKEEEKATEILNDINNGTSFEDAAKQYSECPSSASGGDLGYFTRGKMVPEFEDAAFNMQVGQVSEPVKTQFGYHIIKVVDKKEAEIMPLEKVKNSITQQLLAKKQEEMYMSRSNQLKILYEVKYIK